MKYVYCIPRLNQISSFLSFSKKYNAGFEYNDFFLPSVLDDEEKVKEILSAYKALDRDRSEDTLHGAFLDICVNSDDPLIFKTSDYRIRQSMHIAMELGVKAVIFHTNYIPTFRLESYRRSWLDRNERYWRNLLSEYPKLMVYMENMFDDDPELLKQLAIRMKNEPRFGVCFDLAHAYISNTPLPEWISELATYARHWHINDNDKLQDSHHPVGSMQLPWSLYKEYTEALPKEKRPSVLLEVRRYEDLEASVKYMEEHGMYPFC